MQVTDIKIRKTFPEGNVKAVISVTLDDFIAIHEIKVVQGNGRIFVAMPNRLDYIVHPISAQARVSEAMDGAFGFLQNKKQGV